MKSDFEYSQVRYSAQQSVMHWCSQSGQDRMSRQALKIRSLGLCPLGPPWLCESRADVNILKAKHSHAYFKDQVLRFLWNNKVFGWSNRSHELILNLMM